MTHRLCIFDFDGTLADSRECMMVAFNRGAERFGYRRLEHGEIESLRHRSSREIMKAMKISRWRVPQIALYVREQARLGEAPPLFAGVPEMLETLHASGTRLALVSSNGEPLIRRALGEHLSSLFASMHCEASLFGKAARFRQALKAANLAADAALAIGDEERDLKAARRAGVRFGAVNWGYAAPDVFRRLGADYFFNDPSDIIALLEPKAGA